MLKTNHVIRAQGLELVSISHVNHFWNYLALSHYHWKKIPEVYPNAKTLIDISSPMLFIIFGEKNTPKMSKKKCQKICQIL